MKKILSLFFCIIIPFMFFCPLSSGAFDVQGTEYPEPEPLLFPPDVDFSLYDYYFLTVSGTSEKPSYKFYAIKDNSDSDSFFYRNRLFFEVGLQSSATYLRLNSFSKYSVHTIYSIDCYSYSFSTGRWGSNTSTGLFNGFSFDGFCDFNSQSDKYIIGCNTDIYDYSGYLVRSGDYDTLCSFFLNGLKGSDNKTEKPTESTTSSDSSSANFSGIASDVSDLKKYFYSFASLNGELQNLALLFNIVNTSIHQLENSLVDKLNGIVISINGIDFNNFSNSLDLEFSGISMSINEVISEIDNISFSLSDFITSLNSHFSELFSVIRSESSITREAISSLPDNFEELLEYLFIPKEDHFSYFDDLKENFGFVKQIVDIGDALVNEGQFSSVPPLYTFEINNSFLGHFSFSIDFSIIPFEYVKFFRNFIRGIVLIFFVRRTRRRLPSVINGE